MTENNVFQQMQQATVLSNTSKDLGFEIPTESVPLPSKGIIYPVGNPLSNEETIDIKCMTAKEEDLLTSKALIKNGTVISQLLKSCILNKMIDPDDMIIGDRNALLIAIRITGYGSEYKVEVNCPSCDEKFVNSFSLNGLKIKSIGAQPVQPNMNLFEYVTPMSGLKVHFKLLTGRDELEISKMADRNKKLQTQIDTNVTSRLLYSIVSVNGEQDRSKIAKISSNMRAGDARALRKYMDEIEPNVEMKQKVTCPHCSEESEVSIPLGLSFLWPDIGS